MGWKNSGLTYSQTIRIKKTTMLILKYGRITNLRNYKLSNQAYDEFKKSFQLKK